MIDGRNSAEVFLSNMDYAQVAAAVITQEYIDGLQNDYLWEVQERYPNRFLCCGMVDVREAGYLEHGKRLIAQGFTAIKLPANRFLLPGGEGIPHFRRDDATVPGDGKERYPFVDRPR